MRKVVLLIAFLFSLAIISEAQSFSINTDGSIADTSAMLDVKSTSKGILIPRMTKAQRNLIFAPATGVLIYQTGPDSVGFHYYDGTAWTWLANATANAGWLTTGNNGITSNHFLGTLTDSALKFRIRNTPSGFIDSATFSTALGYRTLTSMTTGIFNTAFGYRTLDSVTTGFWNTGMGHLTLGRNKNGYDNTGIGNEAMRQQVYGISNTALGGGAMRDADSNYFSTALGVSALFVAKGTTGNTAVGWVALNEHETGNYNTAIGTEALQLDSSGTLNVAVGWRSSKNNKRGVQNTAVGVGSLEQTISGSFNTAMGRSAAFFNDTADYVTAFGYSALANNKRDFNTAVGAFAGNTNSLTSTVVTQGAENTMIGYATLTGNAFGSQNVAIGYKANAIFEPNTFFSGTAPSRNVAIGDSTMYGNRGNDNIGIGYRALGSINATTMNQNVAIGSRALSQAVSTYPNTAVGYISMDSMTTGYANTALGSYTMGRLKTGINNTALGNAAMYEATGSVVVENTAVGNNALRLTRYYGNTAVGAGSLESDTSGVYNTAVGYVSMQENLSGISNSAFGTSALRFNRTGHQNTALGTNAMFNHWQGNNNTAVGYEAMFNDSMGVSNTAIGYQAGYSNDTSWNTYVGLQSGLNNTKGFKNVYVGDEAGEASITGNYNVYVGEDAGWNATGSSNIFIGQGTGSYAIIGDHNTMVGRLGANNFSGVNYDMQRNSTLGAFAGLSFVSSKNNTYLGYASGNQDTAGTYNTASGSGSLNLNRDGDLNTAIGTNALSSTLADQNVGVGYGAGSLNSTGTFNTYLGTGATTDATNYTNSTSIGANSLVGASNSMVLGSIAGVNSAAVTVNVGIGNTTPDARLHIVRNGASGGTYHTNSIMIIEDNANSYIQLSNPTANESGILSGNAQPGGTIRSAVIFRPDSSLQLRTGGNNTRVHVDDAGNVGIGTTTPDSLFSVSDRFMVNNLGEIQYDNTVSNMMYMFRSGTVNTDRMVIAHSPGSNADWGLQYEDASDKFNFLANGTNVMAIDLVNQRVGIGNANPQDNLHVGTSTGATIRIGSLETLEDFGVNIIGTNAHFVPTLDNARSLGNSSQRWTAVWATSGTVNASDARLKKNIESMKYGLNDVMKLKPVKYEWISENADGPKLGFIAQDLLKLIPEVVKTQEFEIDERTGTKTRKELQTYGVYYSDLVPVTVKAIQEQQQIIESQDKKIEDQQKTIDALIKRIEKLENKN